MLETKEYVAIQDFSVSLDNGKTPTYVKKGETLTFDGLNVNIRGEQGSARPLSKVIGEWIAPIGVPIGKSDVKVVNAPRNASGGKIFEHSDYPSDPTVGVKNQPSDSVETLLKSYDRTPPVKLVNGKREVTSDLDDARREVQIINDDANEVRKVTALDGAPVANKSSVEISKQPENKKLVLSTEGQVAKETNYSGKEANEATRKKLTIDYESSGIEVRKTSGKKAPVKKSETVMQTVATDVEVAETSYPATQTTNVGSSTQAQIEQRKTVAKKATAKKKTVAKKKIAVKKKPVAKALESSSNESDDSDLEDIIENAGVAPVLSTKPTVAKGITVESDGQEAVVISKVSRNSKDRVMSEDGIVSKVTIGASEDMDVGDVQFSSNNDFEEPTATFGAGEETAYDILGDDEAKIIDTSDDDIDLNDILSE